MLRNGNHLRALLLGILVVAMIALSWTPVYSMIGAALKAVPGSHPEQARNLQQGIEGNATMNWWAVACPLHDDGRGPALNVTSPNGMSDLFPLTWTQFCYNGLNLYATFHIGLRPGTYMIGLATISPIQCYNPQTHPGLSGGITCNFPLTVIVEPGQYSTVSLNIGGGL